MKIGRIRRKLAEMLTREFGIEIDPQNLWKQDPQHASAKWDCALWGVQTGPPHFLDIYSWNRMTDCVKCGIVYTRLGLEIEVSAKSVEVKL